MQCGIAVPPEFIVTQRTRSPMRFLHTQPFAVLCIAGFVLITIASWFW